MKEEVIKKLLDTYVELNKLHAAPGEKCHMLAMSIQFVERLTRQLLKKEIDESRRG